MQIATQQSDGGFTVTPVTEHLDAANADEFKRDMQPILDTHSSIVLDMSHIEFVDSAGLGALLSCLRRLSGSGGDLKLRGVSGPVRAVFQITRMHKIFDIE